VLQRLISGGFSAQMAHGTVESAKDLYTNWDNLTPAQRSELATSSGLSAAMDGLPPLHTHSLQK
jgi:hypothetical protein